MADDDKKPQPAKPDYMVFLPEATGNPKVSELVNEAFKVASERYPNAAHALKMSFKHRENIASKYAEQVYGAHINEAPEQLPDWLMRVKTGDKNGSV